MRRRRNDAMYEKARYLAESGRIEALGNNVYNVIGDHGTYTVAINHTSKVSCNCQGYLNKGKCSHAEAVELLMKRKKRRS